MKYEVLKEIVEKSNSDTFISTPLFSIPKKWLKPEPYFKSNLQSLHLLFQHTFQSYEIKNEKNYI